MRMGQGRGCLTESIIRRIDRENRAVWFRRMEKRMRRIIWQAMRETLRFLVLTAGTSLFAFVIVPAMELQAERTLIIAEMLAVLAFGTWLGGWIYGPKKNKRDPQTAAGLEGAGAMGKLNEMGFTLLQGVPEGTCPECAVKHPQEQPHNRDSLFYQYKFYNEHGRWPKWEDAMAHCPEEVKMLWIEQLQKLGISIK